MRCIISLGECKLTNEAPKLEDIHRMTSSHPMNK